MVAKQTKSYKQNDGENLWNLFCSCGWDDIRNDVTKIYHYK